MTQKQSIEQVNQKTLCHPVAYIGIGLHCGRKVSMVVRPAKANAGISFLRKDLPVDEGLIAARWYNVVDTEMSTAIGNEYGHTIDTVEHIMAALRGCGVDNALVEVDGPEVPIMDGSAEPFVAMIERVGLQEQSAPRNAIWIQRPIEVRDGDKYAILTPADTPRISVEIDFDNSVVGSQTLSVELVDEAFCRQVARARTFGFVNQVAALKQRGLIKGGSLHNAILVDGDRIVNESGLRYRDEFVRHKVLDCLGDLALAGVPILGHYHACKPGHELNSRLMHTLFEMRESWSYITMSAFNALKGQNERCDKQSRQNMNETPRMQASR
ncbi:MAG: UDP-3-O-acyl-N-acetylglucosamine deacetylase [Gammaproteobacteria bacterium]|nr:UDP-3-O-acyl-N-acetylglucosamine deacetylase [Gammaproteobacteria bacterium]MCF6361826.1 UDP-3-O-acyl-N-acetylglucosamine deacetylase [Gammaproteobacteria bacterium]